MKIIITNRFFFPDESATSRMVTSLARSLTRRGLEVHIVASDAHHDRPTREPPLSTVDGVVVHRVPATAFGRARLWRRAFDYVSFHGCAAWRVRRLARPGDVVIVCTDPPMLSVTIAVALWRSGTVLVNWLHDLFPEAALQLGLFDRKSLPARMLVRLRDASLNCARWNVAPMPRMAEFLSAGGVRKDRLIVIRHWSDGDEIRPVAPEQNSLRRDWGLQDKFVVGYSGNFGRVHEFETILAAAERLRTDPNIVFLFVGGGHRHAWFAGEVQRRNLTNVVMKPLQPRERLAESLSVADVHLISLLPHLETCSVPSKLYGILAAGRPVLFVGDPEGEVARTIRNAGCGMSVGIGEAEALVGNIRQLADSAPFRQALCARARQAFEAEFCEEAGTGQWYRLLSDICADVSATPAAAVPVEGVDTPT